MKKTEYQQKRNPVKTNFTNTADTLGKNRIIPIILVFCLPVLIYLQTLKFGFTYFDDNKIIGKNITYLTNPGNIANVFKTDAFIREGGHFYRPLQTLSFMLDIQVSGGNNTWMFHLSNTLLLGLIACLLYILLKKLFIPPKLALLSTLVYCVHPLFISSVAWLPARGDLLLSFFFLLSFLFFLEYHRKKNGKYLFLHWITFTIALFCKETAAFMPFLVIIYYFVFYSEKRISKAFLLIILYGISETIWFWLRLKALQNLSGQNDVLGVLEQNGKFGFDAFLINLRTIPESLANFFVPVKISPIPNFSFSITLLGLTIIIIIFLLFKKKEKPEKVKIFYLSWFLLLLLPTMLFKHETIDYLNHRFFLPLIGILIFVLSIIPEKWFEKGDIKNSWVIVSLIILLSCFTIINSRSYSDPMTFYNSAISKNSNSAFAYNNRGALYHNQGFLDAAISDYTKALELKPDYTLAYIGRGNAYFIQKINDKAIADYTKAIELKTEDANIYNNRGAAYSRLGMFDKACPDFKKAEELGSKAAGVNIRRFCNEVKNP